MALWVALVGLPVVLVLYPEFRAGMRIWLWLYGLLVAWFFVARTKTVSWRLAAPMEQAREAHLAASALHSEEPFWAGPILTMDRRSSALLSGVLAGRSAP